MENIPDILPGRCTNITRQINNSDRVSVFVNGQYLDGFYQDVLHDFSIQSESLITPDLYLRLREKDRFYKLRHQIFRWLAVRDHSTGEIRNKSMARGYTGSEADEAISYFVSMSYLDDCTFTEKFAREKAESGKWGPAKIRAALSKKGVKKQYIDASLRGLFSNEQSSKTLLKAASGIRTKLMRTDDKLKRKKKLVDFLIRRGFPPDIVFEKSDDILRQLENEET